MTSFLQLIFLLAAIIFIAKLAGHISTRFGQPSVLGELVAGLLLGPSLLDLTRLPFITDPHLHKVILDFGELGVLLLMFLAGLELHLSELTRNSKAAAFSGVMGVIIPVGLGYAAGLLLGQPGNIALFLGLSLGATSVSISAQTLIELNALRSRVGLTLLGAAVFDDVLVILLLSVFLALAGSGSGGIAILLVFIKMLLFLASSAGFGIWLLPKLVRAVKKLAISHGTLTFAIVIMLVYGLAAEIVGGMAAITGTFVAGLMFSRTPEKAEIQPGLKAIAYSIFVPIFFVSIGLGVNITALGVDILWEALLISFIAVAGKLVGSGIGARFGGLSSRESLQIGIGMISRGEVGLIIAQIGVSQGLLDNAAFSSIIVMVVVTTLVTPPLLRLSFKTVDKNLPPRQLAEDQEETT